MRSLRPVIFAFLALFCAPPTHAAHAAGRQTLHGHVPDAVRALKPLRRLDPKKQMRLAIGLPLRNQQGLTDLIRQLYDPHSPSYGQYLTPAQFTDQFGPTRQDYAAVIGFLGSHGLVVTGTHSNRVVIDAAGAVADIEKTFHVKMQEYRHPVENRKFFAPDTEPSVDLSVPLLHIAGFSDFALTHPYYKGPNVRPKTFRAFNGSGSAPDSSYAGPDFRAAYVPGTSLTGTGQCVALVEFDTYYPSDIELYKSDYNIPDIPLINVSIDGGTGTPGDGSGEVSLDIEMAIAMAPGLSAVYVYMGNNSNSNTQWDDMFTQMATDDTCKQISCSWGGESTDPTGDQLLQELAAQGQAFFAASGDSDAYYANGNPIYFPSDSVNVTSVGGTTLTTSGPGGAYTSETVWNWGGGAGSSGGVTTNGYGIPTWQQGLGMTSNQGSTSLRDLPDVAMVADDIQVISDDGAEQGGVGGGGTSFAAPLWAGVMALANQQALANGRGPIGFLNPTIYAIGKGSGYTSAFHDITGGNNFDSGSPSKYSAVTGYDLCDGWGSPAGTNLINAISSPGDSLQVTTGAYSVTGTMGGPFASDTYTLSNTSASSISWSAGKNQSWLTLGQTSGNISVGGSASLVVSLNSQANNLAPGTYTDEITITDAATGVRQLRMVSVDITAPAPGVSTGNTAGITGSTATLNGTTNPYGFSGMGWFEYGLTNSYGSTTRGSAADNAESYSSWGYGSNGGAGLGPVALVEGTGGGIYLEDASTGGRQIDGNNSFALYAGSGAEAVTRQILSANSYGILTFSARFDVNNSVAFSGFNLKSAEGAHFGDSELLSFGVTPSTGNHCIFVGGASTQYINLGSELRGAVIDFQVVWDTFEGVYQIGARFHGGSTYSTVTGSLKAKGSNAAYFGAGNFNTGNTQNLIFDDIQLYTGASLGSENGNLAFSAAVTGLSPATLYHFRSGAYTFSGNSYSADQTFETQSTVPAVVTNAASGITSWMATLNGTVNPEGASTTWYYDFGATPSYGFTTVAQSAGSGNAALPFPFTLTSLQPGTTYYYRLDAQNSNGLILGSGQSFTTSALVDSNGDGLPDDWETYYFGTISVSPTADPSGGGYTNLQNYLAGANPLNTATQLHATIAISGSIATISFNSVAGEVYQVQYSTTLPNSNWTNLGASINGTGGIITVPDNVTAPRFYRVTVQ